MKHLRSALSAAEATGSQIWTVAPQTRSLLRLFHRSGDAAAPDTSPGREEAARGSSWLRSCLQENDVTMSGSRERGAAILCIDEWAGLVMRK